MDFSGLLPEGKQLHELTEEEIEDIMTKIPPEKLSEVESKVRESSRRTKSKTQSAAEKRRENEFNNLLQKGLRK